MVNDYSKNPGICDHCGTFVNAMRIWTPEETAGCPCRCHIPLAILNPEWAAARRKRKKK